MICGAARANSKAAMAWLAALMDEAKRVGLRIQFSLELREPDMTESLATIDSVLKTYPRIDTLEIITEETGMWASSVSVDELRTLVQAYFGELHATIDALLAEGQRDLAKLNVGIEVEVGLKNGDTRVDPMHARKMCAALQHASTGRAPILLRRETDVGHGARSVSRTVGLAADQLAFLAAHTGLEIHP